MYAWVEIPCSSNFTNDSYAVAHVKRSGKLEGNSHFPA